MGSAARQVRGLHLSAAFRRTCRRGSAIAVSWHCNTIEVAKFVARAFSCGYPTHGSISIWNTDDIVDPIGGEICAKLEGGGRLSAAQGVGHQERGLDVAHDDGQNTHLQ